MARPGGTRNKDFAQTRLGLLGTLTREVLSDRSRLSSFNELARAAGVSRTTLRHYFEDRSGVIAALIGYWATFEPAGEVPRTGSAFERLEAALLFLVSGWDRGLGDFFELGLQPAIGDQRVGPAFVTHFLEPLLQNFEVQLGDLVREGVLGPTDARFASIELVSPVVMALLHQRSLSGAGCRPLDVVAFTRDHVRRFVDARRP
ncbi:MAG: TetR/AcrR family transcriptional regulator [Myxococcaceae bacterium]|nr:TetR/AcrR family transcriptional regulator [Myxococcaceae bacterium]